MTFTHKNKIFTEREIQEGKACILFKSKLNFSENKLKMYIH